MIITIHALPQPSTAMSRAERAMVGYLARLHDRQGDVLLLSVRRAAQATRMERRDVDVVLRGMAAARVIEVDAT